MPSEKAITTNARIFLDNAQHCYHGNPGMVWRHLSSVTSLLAKSDDKVEKFFLFFDSTHFFVMET